MREALQARLSEGLKKLQIELNQEQQKKLIRYVELMAKWNKAYNLTSVRESHGHVGQTHT